MNRKGFCIFIDTTFQGPVPSVREGDYDHVVVFNTQREAELEIVDFLTTRLQEFIDGVHLITFLLLSSISQP